MLKDLKIFKRMLSLVGYIKWIYIISLLGSGISGGLRAALITLLYKNTFDAAVKVNRFHYQYIIYLTLILIVISILERYFNFLFARSTRIIQGNIRKTTFIKLSKMALSNFESKHSGEILSRMNNDVNAMEQAYSAKMQNLINTLISGISAIAIMIALDFRIAAVSITLSIVSTLISTRFIPLLRKSNRKMLEHIAAMTKVVSDAAAGNSTIKILNLYGLFTTKFNTINLAWTKENNSQIIAASFISGIQLVLQTVNFLGVLIAGLFFIFTGSTTIGSVVGIILQQNTVGFMFSSIGDFTNDMQQSLSGAERVFDLLDGLEEQKPENNLDTSQYEIELRDVSFAYDEHAILKNINISVGKNKTVGIVGRSGSGKSTLFKLLLGFYPTKKGEIYIKQKSIGQYTLPQARDLISYVPQNAYIFSGTVKENIAMGKEKASDEEITSAAKIAYAHDFIMKLPEKYDTNVGESGSNLSGGERQRIAIARAILKNAPILLLDEATSALDINSELIVRQALENLMKDRTTIIITHRLYTIRHADFIYVLDHGEVVEKGTHEDLIKMRGLYSDLFNTFD